MPKHLLILPLLKLFQALLESLYLSRVLQYLVEYMLRLFFLLFLMFLFVYGDFAHELLVMLDLVAALVMDRVHLVAPLVLQLIDGFQLSDYFGEVVLLLGKLLVHLLLVLILLPDAQDHVFVDHVRIQGLLKPLLCQVELGLEDFSPLCTGLQVRKVKLLLRLQFLHEYLVVALV